MSTSVFSWFWCCIVHRTYSWCKANRHLVTVHNEFSVVLLWNLQLSICCLICTSDKIQTEMLCLLPCVLEHCVYRYDIIYLGMITCLAISFLCEPVASFQLGIFCHPVHLSMSAAWRISQYIGLLMEYILFNLSQLWIHGSAVYSLLWK